MKKTVVSLLFVALLPLCLALTCNTSQQKTAYATLSTVEQGVLLANQAYLDTVVTGMSSTNAVPTVEAAFNDVQLTIRTAIALSTGGGAATAPAAVVAKATAFTNTINVASHK